MIRSAVIAAENVARLATLSGGGWLPALPLGNLLLPNLRIQPARCPSGRPEDGVIDVQLDRERPVGIVGVLGHTLPAQGLARVTWYADRPGGRVVRRDPPDGGWERVRPRAFRTRDRPISTSGWWTGRPPAAALYQQNYFVLPDAAERVAALRIELDGLGQSFDAGHLWLGRLLRTQRNRNFGRALGPAYATVVERTPGGGAVIGRRLAAREQTVSWTRLTTDEAWALHDLLMQIDLAEPLLVLPSPADLLGRSRDTFLARLKPDAKPQVTEATDKRGRWQLSLTVTEVIE